MSTIEPGLERFLDADPADLFRRLPRMGRLMLTVSNNGITHERIGPVDDVTIDGMTAQLVGDCHDAQIDLSRVNEVRIEKRMVMKGKLFPHIRFLDADGTVLFGLVGMDGEEIIENGLDGLSREALPLPESAAVTPADIPEISIEDNGLTLLEALQEAGNEVEIHYEDAALKQSWRGVIDAIKPARGFINIMFPDFHLHLKAGSAAGWQTAPGSRKMLAEDGTLAGLTIRSQALA